MSPLFFWDVSSRSIRLVVYYRCFKAAYQFHLQANSSPKRMPETDAILLYRRDTLSSDWFFWKAKESMGLLEHEAATRMWE